MVPRFRLNVVASGAAFLSLGIATGCVAQANGCYERRSYHRAWGGDDWRWRAERREHEVREHRLYSGWGYYTPPAFYAPPRVVYPPRDYGPAPTYYFPGAFNVTIPLR